MRRIVSIFLSAVIFLALSVHIAFALDQASANYQSLGSTFGPVVKDISSPNYLMTASIDAIVGLSASPSYSVRSGVPINDINPVPPSPPVCGNGVLESGEACDNGGSNGACPQVCSTGCTVNSCGGGGNNNGGNNGGGGGGGGGGGAAPPAVTGVNFSGRAYPSSDVTILKDGQIAVTTIAGPDGKFSANLTGMQAGMYTFGIYAEDTKSVRSAIFAFPIAVASGTVATVGGIFLAPTISVDKDVVKRGENVAIFGQSVPQASVTIQVNSDPVFVNAGADADGVYLYNFNTVLVDIGQHSTKSKAALGAAVSGFSRAVAFEVNAIGAVQPKGKCGRGDLNCDDRVNLVDFSIAAYWYKQILSANFIPIERERLNGDGKVDLIDFSIMAFYWTG